MSGQHRAPVAPARPAPQPAPGQVTPDPGSPGYDKPETFGKGWK